MENKILNEIELKNIIGGKNTHSTDVFKSKGDMGKCLLSFFRNCD
ncbi:EntF family bacteriocin induction factor [Companilactobacillus futsaii]|uniref:EntF family bacteriocin induction factor n=1 Tax=Companilactobacillus futsaii TaxID=938155 RepID=A0A5B7T5K6_9LACO|nr:EntF family bacteriocin induction factor [Companilactobacillus futsaii]QCX25665.1 EntF family bacteriocin induction factor [Companilactobacillus futsaii]